MFRRTLPLIAALALSVGVVPAFAAPAPSAPAALSAPTSTWLATAAAADTITVGVHADDIATAKAAALAAGMVPLTTFDKVGVAVAVATPAQIRAARTADGVTYVEVDEAARFHLNSSHKATRYDVARTAFTDAPLELDGRGVSIAIVDSGIDGTHPMFRRPGANGPTDLGQDAASSKVVKNVKNTCPFLNPGIFTDFESYPDTEWNAVCFSDVVGNDSDSPSAGGHGTHVAGIAGGYDVTTTDGRELYGAAPGAELVGVSVGASLSVYGGASGLNWVLEHHADPCGDGSCPPIKVVNNSWGTVGGGEYDPASATSKINNLLIGAGVTVVWAAGNDGGNGSANVSSTTGSSPVEGTIMVANYDDGGTGTRTGGLNSSSSRGKNGQKSSYPDISAPGTAITAACRPYLSVCATGLDTDDPNYNTISGTSMAAPHIAGYVAVLLQANPTLTPAQIEDLLEDTAYKFSAGAAYESDIANADNTTSFDKGHGLVDMGAAIASLLGVEDPDGPPPVCTTGNEHLTDPSGDASDALVSIPGGPSEPSLDIVEAWLSSSVNATNPALTDVTFNIRVLDLPETPGLNGSGEGEYFDFNFVAPNGGGFYITSQRDATSESHVLGHFATTRTTDATLVGSFDAETDTISATLPADVLGWNVKDGDIFTSFEVISRRQLVLVVPNTDTATGTCPYVVGADRVAPNTAPTAIFTASSTNVEVGTSITFDGVDSTDAETATADLTYAWDFGDGSTGTGQSVDHAYDATGTYTVTLTVTDEGGLSDDASTDVVVTEVVANRAPTAVAAAEVTSRTANGEGGTKGGPGDGNGYGHCKAKHQEKQAAKGKHADKDACEPGYDTTVAFDGSGSSDPDGDTLTYAWDFGDGTTGTGVFAEHVYKYDSTYTVTLTVSDGEFTSTDTIEVVVGDEAQVAGVSRAASSGLTGLAVVLLAGASLALRRRVSATV